MTHLPQLAQQPPASSPAPSPTTKLLLLQLSLVCENAAQTSRRASEAGGHLRPEDVASLRESLTAAGFFFGQLQASTSVSMSSTSSTSSPSSTWSPAAPLGHATTFCPSMSTSTTFSPSSSSSSTQHHMSAPGSLSSVPRYSASSTLNFSCPSPSSASSPMSSPRPSTPLPPPTSATSAASSVHGPHPSHHHHHNNNPVPAAIASGLLELINNNSSSPPLGSPELRGLPLGVSFHAPRVCVECGRESSIQWRSGPMGSSTLCNACGMRYMRKRKKEEKKRALLAAAQGGSDHPAHRKTNKKQQKRSNSNKRAKIQHKTPAQQSPELSGEKSRHVNSSGSSSSSSEGEEDHHQAATHHRASVNFLLN